MTDCLKCLTPVHEAQHTVNRTPNPAMPNANLIKKESLNPCTHILLTTKNKSYPNIAQLRPAIIPYIGSVTESTVDDNVFLTLVIVVPTWVIEFLYVVSRPVVVVALFIMGK